MRKTIKGLEEELTKVRTELAEVRRYNDVKETIIMGQRETLATIKSERNHFHELSDRLLNILEWNAKEGKGYGK